MTHQTPKKSPADRKTIITNRAAGNLCIAYLLLMLAFLSWQLFDTWIGRYSVLSSVGYDLQGKEVVRLIPYTLFAGALGAVVNGLRSTIHHHEKFERRHSWKYLCAPWMGATLALFVYAILRSSIDVLGGNSAAAISNAQVLSNFSVGALVGYGSKDVFVWLDAKVTKLFPVLPLEGDKKKPAKTSSQSRKRHRKRKNSLRPGVLVRPTSTVTVSSMDNAN